MKKLLKIFGGLLVLIIIAAIAIPMFISADYLKGQLQTQVKKATGRELAIKGKASLSIFPNIAVNVEDVTLGNPAGFSSSYFVHVDKLETGVALMPLLSKRLNITGITLNGAKLNLEQLGSGTKNWDFAGAKPATPAEAPKEAKSAQSSPLKQLNVGKIVIKDTAVNYLKAGSKPMVMDKINLTVSGVAGSAPVKADGGLRVQGMPVDFGLTVDMSGSVPSVNGEMKFGVLDVNALSGGKPTTEAKASAPAAAPSQGWSDAAIDASALKTANAALKLSIEKLKSGALEVSNIAGDVALKNGVMKVDLTNASLYSGTAKGTVAVDGSGAGVGLDLNIAVNEVEVAPLMTALSGDSRLEGKASLSADVNARGTSQRALVNALNGKGALKMADGAITGINIANFLRNAKKGFLAGENSAEKTDFSEMTASYTIAEGMLSNNDLSMKSPVLRIAGSGTTSLPAQTVNYRLVPTIVGSLEGQGGKDMKGLAIPLMITGPWSAVSVTPDVAGLVQDALKNPKALKQNIKDIGGTLKNFNSPKDIGKALFGGKAETAPAATPAATTAPATSAAPAAAEPAPKADKGLNGLLKALEKK